MEKRKRNMKRTNSAAFAHDEDSNSWASEMARVIEAVADGDLSLAMELEMNGRSLRGQFLRTAKTVNSMMSQLNSFASEVTRVARELGTEGKLGGQARVKGVAGIWKDLTARVNQLAANLTAQVRAIAVVARAVTKGDLTQSIAIQARGEVAALRDDLNEMIRNLRETTARNSEQQREILEISDREQRRIGQDLHDDLCQRLTGIEMMSQHLEQNLAARAMPETATAAEITKL